MVRGTGVDVDAPVYVWLQARELATRSSEISRNTRKEEAACKTSSSVVHLGRSIARKVVCAKTEQDAEGETDGRLSEKQGRGGGWWAESRIAARACACACGRGATRNRGEKGGMEDYIQRSYGGGPRRVILRYPRALW